MHIVYVLLSPTFGMHQYTGDLAAQMLGANHDVHVVTTTALPRDRYPAATVIHTPIAHHSTGFKPEGLKLHELLAVRRCILSLHPDLVHFSGVHLWNPVLMRMLQKQGLKVVHTLHDLDPHPDVAFGPLIRLWNRAVTAGADGLVVHGNCYRERLLAGGCQPSRVLATPLLHSFLDAEASAWLDAAPPPGTFEQWVLFFGRLEAYKGLDVLRQALGLLAARDQCVDVLVAGAGDPVGAGLLQAGADLPPHITLRNDRIESADGIDLFRRCGLVVLPYTGATQSALPATAYAFGKPVVVTTSGALSEVVESSGAGWVVPAGDASALADCLATALADPGQLARKGATGREWYERERTRQRQDLSSFYAATKGIDPGEPQS